MVTAIVKHKVKDYDSWFPVFYEHGKERRRFGCIEENVYRSQADANDVIVIMKWPSVQAFQDFAAGSNLEATMARAGVVEPPRIELLTDSVYAAQHPGATAATARAR